MAIKRGYKTIYRSGLPLDEAKQALQAEEAKSPDAAPYLLSLIHILTLPTIYSV